MFYWASKSAISIEKGVFFFIQNRRKRDVFQTRVRAWYTLCSGDGWGWGLIQKTLYCYEQKYKIAMCCCFEEIYMPATKVSTTTTNPPPEIWQWFIKKKQSCQACASKPGNGGNIWVRSRRCGCLVTWFCHQLITKPGNKTATPSWPDPYALCVFVQCRLPVSFPFKFQFGSRVLWRKILISSYHLNSAYDIILRQLTQTWIQFPHYWSLVRGIQRSLNWFPSQRVNYVKRWYFLRC